MTAIQLVEKNSRLLGRILIGVFYLVNGFGLVAAFTGTAGFMASKSVPFPAALLAIVIALWLVAGAFIIAGYQVRLAAFALFAVTVPVTLGIHTPWSADSASFQNELNHFLKNLAILGALLYLAGSQSQLSEPRA